MEGRRRGPTRRVSGGSATAVQTWSVSPAVETFLGSIVCAFDRITSLSGAACGGSACGGSACGGCQERYFDRAQRFQDAVPSNIFVVKPLTDSNSEAARATQRGLRLIQDGQLDEALRDLHDAWQHAQNSSMANSNLGCLHHMLGDDAAAIRWYRQAHRLQPRSETAALARAHLEHRRGSIEEAQRILTAFLQDADPSHVGALGQLGQLHMHAENWSQAAACYHKLTALDSMNRDWHTLLQTCISHLPAKSERAQTPPSSAILPGMFALAMSYAQPLFQTVDSQVDVTKDVQAGSAACSNVASKLGAPSSAQHARQLLETGRAREALPVFKALLQHDTRNVKAIAGLAECYSDLGEFELAIEAGKTLLGVTPDSADANLRLAELLLDAGHGADHVEPYLEVVNKMPDITDLVRARALCIAAELALLREDPKSAYPSAAEAVRIDPEATRHLLILGRSRHASAEYGSALRALSVASSMSSIDGNSRPQAIRQRALVHTAMAETHERQREYADALTQITKAMEFCPGLLSARVVRATVLQQSGRSCEAAKELEEVLRTPFSSSAAATAASASMTAARLRLGYLWLCDGDPRAEQAFEVILNSKQRLPLSVIGCAKVYRAIASEVQSERGGSSARALAQRAEVLIKEGLETHVNLKTEWKDLERNPPTQLLDTVQRLRSICDLDLTCEQAQCLLKLLARVSGRADMLTGSSNHSGMAGMQQIMHPVGSTACLDASLTIPSVPWAPILPAGGGMTLNHFCGVPTPSGKLGSALFAHTPVATPVQQWRKLAVATPQQSDRNRTFSPAEVMAAGGSGVSDFRDHQRSQETSPRVPKSESLNIGWSELIKPESLNFGPELGSGGSAQVFRGTWNGQEVAIKKISGVEHLDEMRKEVNTLRQLRHARLVRFMGACLSPPTLLVVTEYMPGGSLHDRLFGMRKDPPLTFGQRWMISSQTVEALQFLHSHRVVHRDLKSMNILLDAQQNVKLCDFGLSQQMTEMATHIARKLDGEEGGSPRYMAPECYDAVHGKITEKVDIWAMGCILIELFGGILPYADCQTMAQLSARILVQRRSPDVPRNVPPVISATIHRCILYQAYRRPSANELMVELSRSCPAN